MSYFEKLPLSQSSSGEVLLSLNLLLDAKNDEGQTPLMLAAKSQNKKMIDLLLSYGANPSHPSMENVEITGDARSAFNTYYMPKGIATNTFFEMLEDFMWQPTKERRKDIVAFYKKNLTINPRAVSPKDGKPMAVKVIETGDLELIKGVLSNYRITAEALLEKGSDGKSAIDVAYETKNPKLIAIIEAKCKDVGIVLSDYDSTQKMLIFGREEIWSDSVKEAIKTGKLSLSAQDKDGKTLLHLMAESKRTDLLDQALAAQKNPQDLTALTITDKNGKTALDLLPDGDEKVKFVRDLLLKEVAKQKQNGTLITELLEQLDKKTLEELKKNETVQENEAVIKLIDDKLTSKAPKAIKTAAHESQVSTNTAARLASNSEQNITTVQGNDGVALSYTSSRGRA